MTKIKLYIYLASPDALWTSEVGLSLMCPSILIANNWEIWYLNLIQVTAVSSLSS